MKTIIEIGYEKYLLPSDKGVAAIVAALSRAKKVRTDHSESWRGKKKDRYVEVYEDGPDVSVSTVADCVEIRTKTEREEEAEEADELLGLPEADELLGLPMHILGLPEHGTRQN